MNHAALLRIIILWTKNTNINLSLALGEWSEAEHAYEIMQLWLITSTFVCVWRGRTFVCHISHIFISQKLSRQ